MVLVLAALLHAAEVNKSACDHERSRTCREVLQQVKADISICLHCCKSYRGFGMFAAACTANGDKSKLSANRRLSSTSHPRHVSQLSTC